MPARPTFISVRPGGHVKRYRKYGRRWEHTNPLGMSNGELALIAGGVGLTGLVGYLIWKSQQPSSPAISVASGSSPTVTPLPTGLANGYYWEDQGNMLTPGFASSVKAIAMSPDDVATAVYGSVFVPMSPGGNVTFIATSGGAGTGVTFGQTITLPLSYVTAG
jgi:hypothetical protein